MAQLDQNKIAKLPAFTLFESVVAITVITILIGLGTMIYSNVLQAENPLAYYMAKDEVDHRLQQLSEQQLFINGHSDNFQVDSDMYQIEENIDFYKENKSLYLITYIAFSGGEELFREQHLLPNLNNE